jgi:hypothetical protein
MSGGFSLFKNPTGINADPDEKGPRYRCRSPSARWQHNSGPEDAAAAWLRSSPAFRLRIIESLTLEIIARREKPTANQPIERAFVAPGRDLPPAPV